MTQPEVTPRTQTQIGFSPGGQKRVSPQQPQVSEASNREIRDRAGQPGIRFGTERSSSPVKAGLAELSKAASTASLLGISS